MRNHIFSLALLVGIASGCVDTLAETNDLQTLVDRLADAGKGYRPPDAVKAHAKLKEAGTNAFPILVRNSRDMRPACPCFQKDTSDGPTVGETCLDIISMQVERYSYRGKVYPEYLTAGNVAKWWEKNSGRSLQQLQIGAIEWAIAEVESNNDYQTLRKDGLPELKMCLAELKSQQSESTTKK